MKSSASTDAPKAALADLEIRQERLLLDIDQLNDQIIAALTEHGAEVA